MEGVACAEFRTTVDEHGEEATEHGHPARRLGAAIKRQTIPSTAMAVMPKTGQQQGRAKRRRGTSPRIRLLRAAINQYRQIAHHERQGDEEGQAVIADKAQRAPR